jgi:methionyl aminopeptidase
VSWFSRGIEIKRPEELRRMRRAGLVVAQVHSAMLEWGRPGTATAELDAIAADIIARNGAVSSFLGYGTQWGAPPYPGVICISVNEEVVHGIPSDRKLQAGDLVSVDFGASVDGWHADAALTFGVGELDADADRLSADTREALWAGIGAFRRSGRVTDISHAIETSIRASGDYGILAEYTGHGIGSQMHQNPDVPNLGRPGRGARLVEGMCLAIEPMVVLGSPETRVLDDEWTVSTTDGSLAAHWEHTVALTADGLWVLTAEDGGESELTARGLPFGPLGD